MKEKSAGKKARGKSGSIAPGSRSGRTARRDFSGLLSDWAERFLADAVQDRFREWVEGGAWVDPFPFAGDDWPPENPGKAARRRAERTVELLAYVASFAGLDGVDPAGFRELLRRQGYRSAHRSRYTAYFIGPREEYVTLHLDSLSEIDLADLVGIAPFHSLGVTAWKQVGRRLGKRELDRLEKAIREDIYFDYAEDEVSVSFDRRPGGLLALILLT